MVWSDLTVFNVSKQHFTTELRLNDTRLVNTIHSYRVWNKSLFRSYTGCTWTVKSWSPTV